MRIIALSTLKSFWGSDPRYADAEGAVLAWYQEAKRANWSTPQEIKAQFGTASILQNGRVIFNIAGNKYRLVVHVRYDLKIVFIRFIGTHRQYDDIDPQVI